MNLLIIDNYDSYTFNLYQYATLYTSQVVVLRNDQIDEKSLDSILEYFDAVILSPGPGRPERSRDFGICEHVLLRHLPVLGVCLGHQGLAHVFGGVVKHADEPMHGRLSKVFHDGKDLFQDIPSPFQVVRYHSLIVSRDVPDDLKITAWTQDDVVMALKHKTKPFWGVQFHPESICTEYGPQIIRNFCNLVPKVAKQEIPNNVWQMTSIPSSLIPSFTPTCEKTLWIKEIKLEFPLEKAMEKWFLQDKSFWLDSAKVEGSTRWSFMGSCQGPESWAVYYYKETERLVLYRPVEQGWLVSQAKIELFSWIAYMLQRYRLDYRMMQQDWKEVKEAPFPFVGGLVGYFGYEMTDFSNNKPDGSIENLKSITDRLFSTGILDSSSSIDFSSQPPDAAFVFPDRFLVHDHLENQSWWCSLSPQFQPPSKPFHINIPKSPWRDLLPSTATPHLRGFQLAHPRERYIENIAKALQLIRDGESYEVCLTTQLSTKLSKPDTFLFYRHLRDRNPAPYGAYLRFDNSFVVACSSPERYLAMNKEGKISMKPIKGTRARCRPKTEQEVEQCRLRDEEIAQELANDEKDRAENLMIVDLIRNDLNLISEVDTVRVPGLMQVETYATVHQLVSTIESRLRKGLTAVDAVKTCFPPGSMTGAPKKRTVEILQGLEGIRRGPYSGTLGYFSLDGSAHFNVVIRTAVFFKDMVSVGAGGAIVAQSSPEGEYDEMILKSNSVVPSLNDVFRISE